jgi:ribosomal protein S18 acetylase RimI-like enzyme
MECHHYRPYDGGTQMIGAMLIRRAESADLGDVLEISSHNTGRPFEGPEFWKNVTSSRPDLSLVGTDETQVWGWAMAWPDSGSDWDKLRFNLMVRPGLHRRGLGRVLLTELQSAASHAGAVQLRCRAGDDETEAAAFLVASGFEEHHRMVFSSVAVSEADTSRAEAGLARATASGFTFAEYTLAGAPRPDFWAQLNDVHNAVVASMTPYYDDSPGISTPEGLRDFVAGGQYPDRQGRLFLVSQGPQFVGYSSVYHDGELLLQGLTGVHPDARRLGLALGLKALVLRYAKEHGFRYLNTGNRSNNPPILALNRSLGFREYRAELRFWKRLAPKF